MSPFRWVSLVLCGAATIVVFLMINDIGGRMGRHRKPSRLLAAWGWLVGLWEISIGLVLIALGEGTLAIAPVGFGVSMIGLDRLRKKLRI